MYFKHLRGKHDQKDHGRRTTLGGSGGTIQSVSSQTDNVFYRDMYDVARENIFRFLLNDSSINNNLYRDNPVDAADYLAGMIWPFVKKPKRRGENPEYDAATDVRKQVLVFAGRFSRAKTEAGRNKVLSEYRTYIAQLPSKRLQPENKEPARAKPTAERQWQLDSQRHPTKGRYVDGEYVASRRGIELARRLNPFSSEFSERRRQTINQARKNVQAAMDEAAEAQSRYQRSAKTPEDKRQLYQAEEQLKQSEHREALVRSNPFLDIPDDAFPFQHGIESVQNPSMKIGLGFDGEDVSNITTSTNNALAGLVRFFPSSDRNGNPITLFPQLRVLGSVGDVYYRFTATSGALIRIPERDVGDAAHELLHAIEDAHPRIRSRVQEFYDYRTRGDKATTKDPSNSPYAAPFDTKLDEWGDPYSGRIYSPEDVRSTTRLGGASEVLPQIISSLQGFTYSEEAERTLRDEEHLAFFFDVLSEPDNWG